ncbi:MAG: type II secretion system protein N, partial [Acidiferrobacteraceae bacterium]
MSAGFLHLPELPSSPWFPRVLNLIAALLLASGAAHWTWTLIHPPVAPVTLPAEAAIPSAPASADALVSAHLFGKADVAATPALDSIPVSSLNLVLNGIISAGNDSHALISVNGGEQAPFAVGDEVTTGVTLAAVYDDRVIISRGGKKESLLMYEDTGGSSAAALPSPAAGPAVVPMGKNRFNLSRSKLQNQLRRPDVLAQA